MLVYLAIFIAGAAMASLFFLFARRDASSRRMTASDHLHYSVPPSMIKKAVGRVQ